MIIKFKRLTEAAIVPRKAHQTDAGFDLYAVYGCTVLPKCSAVCPLGFKMELPVGYEAQIRPRSGIAIKKGVTVSNSPGTIDQGFTGEVMVGLTNHSDFPFQILPGDRIAQMVIQKVEPATFEEVDELSDTERGEGGFGSTGK